MVAFPVFILDISPSFSACWKIVSDYRLIYKGIWAPSTISFGGNLYIGQQDFREQSPMPLAAILLGRHSVVGHGVQELLAEGETTNHEKDCRGEIGLVRGRAKGLPQQPPHGGMRPLRNLSHRLADVSTGARVV